MSRRRRAFTLIELLVVIAIIAILSVVVVLTLNPAGTLQQSRDNNRLSDMDTLTHALGLFQADQAVVSGPGSLGTANTVYVSLPDPTAGTSAGSNCSSLGLPALPLGYAYHCAGPNYYRKIDGTGWIPVLFSSITTGSPLGQLPIDPTNTSSSRLYYAYTTNGSQYEVTTPLESSKYRLGGSNDQIGPDGGTLATVYEKGSKLGLEPLDYGDPSLVGLWTFDEGAGGTAYDYSGNNATGTWSGSGTHWVAGKIGSGAGQFATSTSDFVNVGHQNQLVVSLGSLTETAWFRIVAAGSFQESLIDYKQISSNAAGYDLEVRDTGVELRIANGTAQAGSATGGNRGDGVWHQAAGVIDRNGGNLLTYVDGILVGSTPFTTSWDLTSTSTMPFMLGGYLPSTPNLTGSLDDVRIYNRALSAAEIAAMYSGGK